MVAPPRTPKTGMWPQPRIGDTLHLGEMTVSQAKELLRRMEKFVATTAKFVELKEKTAKMASSAANLFVATDGTAELEEKGSTKQLQIGKRPGKTGPDIGEGQIGMKDKKRKRDTLEEHHEHHEHMRRLARIQSSRASRVNVTKFVQGLEALDQEEYESNVKKLAKGGGDDSDK